jgi:hypothetical protein
MEFPGTQGGRHFEVDGAIGFGIISFILLHFLTIVRTVPLFTGIICLCINEARKCNGIKNLSRISRNVKPFKGGLS